MPTARVVREIEENRISETDSAAREGPVGTPNRISAPRLRRNWRALIFDLTSLVLSGGLTFIILLLVRRGWHANGSAQASHWVSSIAFFLLFVSGVVLICAKRQLYDFPRMRLERSELFRLAPFLFGALLAAVFCLYLIGPPKAVQIGFFLAGGLGTATLVLWREIHMTTRARIRPNGNPSVTRLLVVGTNTMSKAFASYMNSEPSRQVVLGFLDEYQGSAHPVLGKPEDLVEIADKYFIDEVVIASPSDAELMGMLSIKASHARVNLSIASPYHNRNAGVAGKPSAGAVHYRLVELHREPNRFFSLLLKRAMDIVLSTLLLVFTAPLTLAVAIAIKLDSRGSIFYRSRRLGKKGQVFDCCKFRTMVCDADAMRGHLQHLNDRQRILFKIKNDPRTTRLGKTLRKYSIDELPQLWNVLTGSMSLIGPRPPLPEEFEQYASEHRRRLRVKPGLTGLWQVTARNDPSFETYVKLDLQYVERWSLWLDLKILLKTVPTVVRGTGC